MTQDDNQTPVDRALVDQTPSEMSSTNLDFNPGADPELRRKVEEALDMILPYLMADGGSVRVTDITLDLVVELDLLRALLSCLFRFLTLCEGILMAFQRCVEQFL